MPGNTNGYYLEVNEAAQVEGQPSEWDQCFMNMIVVAFRPETGLY